MIQSWVSNWAPLASTVRRFTTSPSSIPKAVTNTTNATVRPAKISRTFMFPRTPRSPAVVAGVRARSSLNAYHGTGRASRRGRSFTMQRVTRIGPVLRGRALGVTFLLCAAATTARAADAVLDIWAATSLREPVTVLARRFEGEAKGRKVNLVFGASSALARQIQSGAPADLFLSADDVSVDRLQADGFVKPDTRRIFASNQ